MRLPVLFVLLAVSRLAAQDPADFQGWMDQGVQAFKDGNYAVAVASFERAIQIRPDDPNAHLYLGTAYLQLYIPGAASPENSAAATLATDQFRLVLKLDPANQDAIASVGSLLVNQKKWDEAGKWYDGVAASDPNNADACYTMGFIAWSKWYPAYTAARRNLGMTLEEPGPIKDIPVREKLKNEFGPVIEAGLQALDKALRINPQYDDAMAYMNLLIRERADLRDNAEEYRHDIATADEWVEKALAAKKEKFEARQQPETPQRITIDGNVQESKLVSRIPPVYPPMALEARLSGVVHLAAVIGKDGRVLDIKLIGGHPLLVPAALEAVKQWVYQPTLLNGNPVEVETQIDVSFLLP